MVRAKMVYANLTTTDHGNGYKSQKVRFEARYDATIPEDQRFQKASPSGSIEIQIDNQAALDQLKLGQAYYVDFTEVPPEPAPAAA